MGKKKANSHFCAAELFANYFNRLIQLKMELKNLLKDKKVWFASFLITWAAALQGHMMWLQKQDSFKQKFGNLDDNDDQRNLN
ncbi:uncharacterized protein LOC130802627 [Amaranthus tricolor]|uniref:uncharacterized protein LOC130802627 n=1 Tax=Amaranthus tricolor TaxID=29722 RepID=UPI00258627C3|nr:uncharacterized protein LOC130802627 [Amaranthus tricolor]